MRSFSVFVILTLFIVLAKAAIEDPDDQYIRILGVIQRADLLSQHGESNLAKAKYEQAQTQLVSLKQSNPTWNPKVMAFRSDYLAGRIAALSQTNAPDNSAAKPETKSDTKTAASLSTEQVKLLDAGAEPRRMLRLSPKPGDKQHLSMTLKMAMAMGMGAPPGQPMKMPAIQTVLDATVKTVSTDGDIAYETVMSDIGVADEPGALTQMAEAMKASLASVKGLTTTGTMSNRGLNKGTQIKLPAGAAPQMRQLMDQMKESLANVMSPLPDEAVGPGAKWEVNLPLKSQGMTFDQTATYQLTSIEGDRVNLTVSMVQHGANQKVQNPALPNVNVEVTKMTGSGTGTVALDLAQLLPSRATLTSHTEMSMNTNAGGQNQAMTVKTDMDMRLEAE